LRLCFYLCFLVFYLGFLCCRYCRTRSSLSLPFRLPYIDFYLLHFTLKYHCTHLFIFACILICLFSHFYFSATCAVITSSKSECAPTSASSLL
jgi:hypothetical protein